MLVLTLRVGGDGNRVAGQSGLLCRDLVLTYAHTPVLSPLACWDCRLGQLDPTFVWHVESVTFLAASSLVLRSLLIRKLNLVKASM